MAFNGCLHTSPGTDSDMFGSFSQNLSPDLEPVPFPHQEPVGFPFMGMQLTSASFSQGSIKSGTSDHIMQLALHQSAGLQASLVALKAESHATHLAQAKKEQDGKSTGTTYQRHIKRYNQWLQYQTEQMARLMGWTSIPGFPITTAKVSMFFNMKPPVRR